MTSDDWNQRSSEVASRLRDLLSAVDDLSYDMLRDAARRREGRPAADKRLLQARRALEKAAHILENLDHSTRSDSDIADSGDE